MKVFYQLSEKEIRIQLNGHERALEAYEITEHRERYGKNELDGENRQSVLNIFLRQFTDFLVIILIGAAIISGFLGDMESMAVILFVITMNAVLGTVQTVKAEKSLAGLKKLSAPEAKVLRNGNVMMLPAEEIVVGDEVILEAGDYVPADGRVIESAGLKVDESALTGESLGVEKTTETIENEVPLGDRVNMAYSGSFVIYGRGRLLITNVGMQTEVGKIAGLLKETKEKKTPLQRNLDDFGKKLSILILVFCVILFGISVWRGESAANAFLFAVALAVAAIPEALSSIVTIVLAFGTQKMAKEKAIIRKLQAVEGLGSVSVICSDKTGTLTQNHMTVEQYYVDGEAIQKSEMMLENELQRKLLEYGMLCNDACVNGEEESGDPTETALIRAGIEAGVNAGIRQEHHRISEIPFDSERKMMSVLCQEKEQKVMITKGAVDELLKRVFWIVSTEGLEACDEKRKEEISRQNEAFSKEGLRVLAVTYKMTEEMCISLKMENDLIFLGLIAMMDPPREEAEMAVDTCKKAGIRPVMITGDHKVTASEIAKRLGILQEGTIACDGMEIDSMSDEELSGFVEKVSVYARVSPEHKIRIVRAWQERGNVVAMTGDGVNDAPALKQADVGVAMGITGTEVSKDAAAMVLADDNFSTIVKAVENGRNIYQNIKRAIQFLLSGNFGAILTVLAASLAGLPVPFAPVHLLFINLLTDSLPAIALGMEPHRANVMEEKPRPIEEPILTKSFLVQLGSQGVIIAVMTMAAFLTGLFREGALLGSTMAFGTLCMARLFHGFSSKSEKAVWNKKMLWNNQYLILACLTGFVLVSMVLLISELNVVFHVQTLKFSQYVVVCGYAFLSFVLIQLGKGEKGTWI